ncbi:DUF2510 domain-containing protein [Mycobacterium sp. Aquia_213]|uniref:DUF2510 domain-containing protein n=1 Tax=Mycobacterium sp. Aquia_213 TaxID=2991728 RepID=UPI00227218C9|nr:DUF2510 domain-containing protein [Mycobacterium sp. Aquia_213]WAC92197.1 DUF2510 domain-containing protein [Mycobacterium sp. Aquia_213]
MADEIDSDSSPDGDKHADNPDPQVPEHGLRRAWQQIPPGLRTVIPLVLLVAAVIVGFYNWVRPSGDDWSHLPSRLVCQVQSGTRPPPAITVASVGVTHPRTNVLQLEAHFAQPLPASPGFQMTYRLANNGTAFAVLNQRQDSDDLAIRNVRGDGADIRTDLGTHARRTAPDTIEMTLNLSKFGFDKDFVNPALTVSSQLDVPPAEPVTYALQICHG